MNVDIRHLIQAVIHSLDNEVLPHLEAQAAPASNVRSCLTLLASIETRLALEPQLLRDDNLELRQLLQECIDSADTIGLDAATRDAVRNALSASESQSPVTGTLSEDNRRYQEALTTVINSLPVARGNKQEFRAKLHRYLAATSQREMQLAEAGLARVPV